MRTHVFRLLITGGLSLVLAAGCDEVKSIFEDDVASDSRGGEAVVSNALLITDIGLELTDTTRYDTGALAVSVVTGLLKTEVDTCTLASGVWTCTADYDLRGGTFAATATVAFAPTLFGTGVPNFYAPTFTDTAYVSISADDSFNTAPSQEIFVEIVNTAFVIDGFADWANTASGVLTYNGSLTFHVRVEIGRDTPQSGDDITYDGTYVQTFNNVTVAEGSTVPSGGTMTFTINQDVEPNPEGVGGINGDYDVNGSVTFSSGGATMTIGTHSYQVVIDSNHNVTITPL